MKWPWMTLLYVWPNHIPVESAQYPSWNMNKHNILYALTPRPNLGIKQHSLKYYNRDRGIDLINLINILHNKKCWLFIPPYYDEIMSIVSYKYTKTISSSNFNHIKTVSEYELSWFMENRYPYECQVSPLGSEHHGPTIRQ